MNSLLRAGVWFMTAVELAVGVVATLARPPALHGQAGRRRNDGAHDRRAASDRADVAAAVAEGGLLRTPPKQY
jgi:hypothetical protein